MLDATQLRKLIRELQDGNDAAQRQAMQALKLQTEEDWASAPADVVQSLLRALQASLKTGQSFLHKDIATTLGNVGIRSKGAIPQLIELLRDGIPDVNREAAVVALGRMGKSAKAAVGALINLVTSTRPGLCNQSIRALGNIGCADERVRSALVPLWPASEQLQNSTAQLAITLCKLRIDARNLAAVLSRTLMSHPEASLRKLAAEALSHCTANDVDVVPSLLAASLSDSNEDVRKVALGGLTQLKVSQEKAIAVSAKQLSNALYAEAALRKSGAAAVPALMKALEDDDRMTRVKAVRTLSNLGEAAIAAVDLLTTTVRDPDAEVRLAAAKSLWSISKNAEVVIPVLTELLQSKWLAALVGEEPRRMFLQSVIETLRRIGPPARAANTALVRMTKDRNRHVAESALSALKVIDPPKAKVS